MTKIIFLTLLLVASALADQSVEVPSPHQEVSSVQGPAPVQSSPPSSGVVVSAQPVVESVPVVHQPAPVHVVGEPQHQHHHEHHQHSHPEHVSHEGHHHLAGEPHHEHHHQQLHSQAPPAAGVSYYSPAAGLIQVVGNEQVKPVVGGVRNFEQYGQPESASIPANYKPFGSWGLYIGGNPADGYYTNYYKALGNSMDKQQQSGVVDQVKPAVSPSSSSSPSVSQTAAFSPVLRQASSSPYVGADYYPFAYSPADLSVHSSSSFYQPHSAMVSAGSVSPQVYSSGVVPEVPSGPYLSYADQYATKRVGGQAPFQQQQVQQVQQQQQQQQHQQQQQQHTPSKGYQQRLSYASYPAASPAVHGQHQHQQHQQVVAYPVPVGSQIVGSQPGVDGAFNPYGIHAFTRYAVKPTVVSSDSTYYSYNYPSYKQMSSSSSSASSGVQHQPFNFYGYPLNQLHYSQGSIVEPSPTVSGANQVVGSSGVVVDQSAPVVEPHHHHHGQVEPVAASEKSETVLKDVKDKSKN